MRTPAAVLAGLLLLAACGGAQEADGDSDTGGAAGATCTPLEATPAPRELLRRIDLGEQVTWEQVAADGASVNAAGVAEEEAVAPVLAGIRASLHAQDWEVFSLDDEGFEAEVLARDPEGVLLGITLREGGCPSRVDVTLSLTDYAALD